MHKCFAPVSIHLLIRVNTSWVSLILCCQQTHVNLLARHLKKSTQLHKDEEITQFVSYTFVDVKSLTWSSGGDGGQVATQPQVKAGSIRGQETCCRNWCQCICSHLGLSVSQEDWLDEYSKPDTQRTMGNQTSSAVNFQEEYEGRNLSSTLQITLHIN